MDEREDLLNAVLKAASDPTRRKIVTMLAQHGPLRVTDIARNFDMSLNSVSKHIKVLEQAKLVTRRTEWREHLIEVDMAPLSFVDAWFSEMRSIWTLRFEALEAALTKDQDDD